MRWIGTLVLLLAAITLTAIAVYPHLGPSDDSLSHRVELVTGSTAARAAPHPKRTGRRVVEAAAPEVAKSDPLPPLGDPSLPREKSIRGRVTDTKGAPVPGARVSAFYRRTQPANESVEACLVRTDKDGTYVLGPLDVRSYAVFATKKGLGTALEESKVPGEIVDLVLAPGATIQGTITRRKDKKPVAGAHVHLFAGNLVRIDVDSDAAGRYVFEDVPARGSAVQGSHLVVMHDDFEKAEKNNLLLLAGRTVTADFQLESGGTLSGKVTDARTHGPLSGATVAEGFESYEKSVVADAKGNYVLHHVDCSPNQTFVAQAPGHLSFSGQSDGSGTLDFSLKAARSLSGRVLGPDGQPVPHAHLHLQVLKQDPDWAGSGSMTSTETKSDGSYRFDQVTPGRVVVVAFAEGFGPGESDPIEIGESGDTLPVDVNLSRGTVVEGKAVLQDGSPIPGIQIRVWGNFNSGKLRYAGNYAWQNNPARITDQDGHFRLTTAFSGNLTIYGGDNAHGWTNVQKTAQPGDRITGIVLRFGGAHVAGLVKNQDGAAVPGARVSAYSNNGSRRVRHWYSAQCDEAGHFAMSGMEEGSYTLTAWSPLGRSKPMQGVTTGTEDVVLELGASCTLRGSVRDAAGGQPITEFWLTLQPVQSPTGRRSGRYWGNEIKSPDGTFEHVVSPGHYRLIVKARGHAPQVKEDLAIEEGIEPPAQSFDLQKGATVYGVLQGTDGRPAARGYVSLRVLREPGEAAQPTDGFLSVSDMTDEAGRFFLQGVAPGTYAVSVNLGDRGAAETQVDVPGTTDVHRDLQLLPTGTLTVQVLDKDGKPIPQVYVYFYDKSDQWIGWGGMTNPQGFTQPRPVRQGTVVIRTWHMQNKYQSSTATAQVAAGETTSAKVTMEKRNEKETPGNGG